MVTLVEYPYREYAGNQRLVFSRRAAYAKFTRAFRTGLAGGILAEFRFAGEARTNNTLDTSSLALQYNHGLPRPIYWVLWLWQRLRGEVLVNDKSVLLLRHQGYQLLLRNVVVFNPLLSSEEAFIQRFQQQYHLQLQGMRGEWRIRRHLFDRHNGALYPLLEGVRSDSGPDEEMWRWIAHKARPTLSLRDERLNDGWQMTESLESNALVLYEFMPLNGRDEEDHSPR
jgi:beta-xylosidase